MTKFTKTRVSKYYLHWWDEKKERFTTEEEEKETNYGGIVFDNEGLMKSYPGGYKYWLQRKYKDAPRWVKNLCKERHQKKS